MTAVAPVEHSTVPRELQFKVLVIGEFGVGELRLAYREASQTNLGQVDCEICRNQD